jgi:hypothetical protein
LRSSLKLTEIAERDQKREKTAAGSRSLPRSGGLLVPPCRRERKNIVFFILKE